MRRLCGFRLALLLGLASLFSALLVVSPIATPQARALADSDVVFTEIHYHPQAVGENFPDFDDREDTEFVEVTNTGSSPVSMTGWCIDEAVEYCFDAGTTLASGQSWVIARDANRFQDLYNTAPNAIYDGKLSNNGEEVVLRKSDTVMVSIEWTDTDPWPVSADGTGPSLELVSLAGSTESPANWAGSASVNGTPGSTPMTGSAAIPLVISHDAPDIVSPGQNITISATAVNTASATLVYDVDYGSNQQQPMSLANGSWQTTVSGIGAGSILRYRIQVSAPGGSTTSPRVEDSVNWWATVVPSSPVTSVPVLDLYFAPDDWEDIDDNNCGCAGAVAYEGKVWTNVVARRAGFTSLNANKPNLRLDFPQGHPFEAEFLDEPSDELTLDAGTTNRDQIREQLSWDLYERMGFARIASTHVRVSNAGDYFGLFLLREEQDGNWRARNNFDRGVFYKVEPSNIPGPSFGFAGTYQKKEGFDESDDAIIALKQCLDQTGNALRNCMLDTVDIVQMIDEMAAVMLIRQGDQREFNFFVNRDNAENGLWRVQPDDLDRTWGSSMTNPSTNSLTVHRRCIGTDGPPANEMCRAMTRVPEFYEMYNRRLRTLVDEYLADPIVTAQISQTAALIQSEWNDDEDKWNRESASFPTIRDALLNFVPGYVNHLRGGGHDGEVPSAQSSNPAINIVEFSPDDGTGFSYAKLSNPSNNESVDASGWTLTGFDPLPNGSVILAGQTVVVTNDDSQFRSLQPNFNSIRIWTSGALGPQTTLQRRNGTTADIAGQAPPAPMILNEWNAVSGSNTLAEGDPVLGSIPGNGGDWFEVVVVEDDLDVRGWTLVLTDADGGPSAIRDEFVFSNEPLLASLQAGTIITVTEDFDDDVSWQPGAGDWTLNFQANSADEGRYFSAASQENFDTNDDDWRLTIRNAAGAIVFGPAGEGAGSVTGITNDEIGELEVDPSATIDFLNDYGDGNDSTFGLPNTSGGLTQDFSVLRFPYVFGDVECNGDETLRDALKIALLEAGDLASAPSCPLGNPAIQVFGPGADRNTDGTVTDADTINALECLVGLPGADCS